ncbi:putative RNA-binding post-transcriptional regulator cip2 [Xylogone sp. PMI_703]|nr:putative RNA-binding post-transcriptional regulator cip2 [Xylogone sp. PMI_703]
MSQQYQDMYQEYATNRSPGSTRGYSGLSINRQTSRQFDAYSTLQQGLYTAEDHAARFEPSSRFDRIPSATLSNYPYDNQTWSYAATANTIGGNRLKPTTTARRAGIPATWLEPQLTTSMPSLSLHQLGNTFSQQQMQSHQRISPPPGEEELIPTAIVIKNIPFAVKKEQLVALMTEMNLPLPYAFNYHFDNGVFRGLAFANFTTAEETSQVIEAMNHMDLQGRKLRVEYKKMLPAAERDRIERDKRERRGQLQEQHQPMQPGSLHNQASLSSINSGIPATSPSPVSMRTDMKLSEFCYNQSDFVSSIAGIDLNDPTTLGFYTELLLFKGDANREILIFPSTITPMERRTIHTLAHNMGLDHRSEGTGDMRQIQILKRPANKGSNTTTISQPVPQLPTGYFNESQRRGLNRAATIDFGESRGLDSGYYSHTLGRQGSGLLDIPGSPGVGSLSAAQNLRAAKSFADLRSYTPSPVPSSASFPVNLTQNVSRYAEYGLATGASGTPNLTPTSAGGNSRDSDFLANGISNMTLGYDRPSARSNGRIGGERENHGISAGAIGSQRPSNGNNYDDNQRNGTSTVERQPRGPGSDWPTGFTRPRQNGHVTRGSGELDLKSVERDWDDNMTQDSSDRSTQQSTSRFM